MRFKRIPLYSQILAAMVIGAVIGLVTGKSAAPFGELGKAIIQLVKTFAAPLLFFAVVDAFVRTHVKWKNAAAMIAISAINATIALGIGLGISNALKPGTYMAGKLQLSTQAEAPAKLEKLDFIKSLSSSVPTSVLQPFVDGSIITIIFLAVIIGLALRRARRDQSEYTKVLEDAASAGLKVTEIILAWIIKLVPLAVFGVVAKTVGEHGLAPLKGLGAYLGVGLLGLVLHVAITYQAWIVFGARMTLKRFWGGAKDPVAYALGAASSLATLPVTLKALDQMKVSPQSARLAACVGTNLNNDGILLYEAMAVLFVAQAHGIHLTLSQQILAAASCAMAGIGIGGIPDAGLISLSLVLATVGLPIELLPLLLTVDWVMGRARAVTNVLSDMLVAVLLDRFDSKK